MSIRVLLLAVALALAPASLAAPAALPGDSVYQLSATLTDQDGRAHEWRSLRGKPRVVGMFYTSCRYVCPMIVDSLRAVERGLPATGKGRLGLVLVSIDPARDTPEALARVMRERRLDPANWLLLQPRAADVRAIAGVLGVRYRATEDGEFNHTSTLVLLDGDGRVRARTDRIGGKGDPGFLEAVRAVLTR